MSQSKGASVGAEQGCGDHVARGEAPTGSSVLEAWCSKRSGVAVDAEVDEERRGWRRGKAVDAFAAHKPSNRFAIRVLVVRYVRGVLSLGRQDPNAVRRNRACV